MDDIDKLILKHKRDIKDAKRIWFTYTRSGLGRHIVEVENYYESKEAAERSGQ